MIVVISNIIVPKHFQGLTLFPFVFFNKKENSLKPELLNHENIHIYQQKEMFLIFFLIWYVFEFVFRLFQYKNKILAYRNISFEREAYQNDHNFDYLKNRKLYTSFKYLQKNKKCKQEF